MKYTALIIMFVTVVARIFGFIREMLMSNFYGTSQIAEVVVIAMAVPTVLFAFLFNSLNTSFIPSFNRVKIERGEKEAEIFTSNVSNVVMLMSVFICLVGILLARPLVFVMASGFSGEKLETTIKFVRIVLIGASFNSIAAIFSGYLNVKGSYIVPAMRAVVQNIFLILFTVLSVYTDKYVLAIGILVATIAQNLILIPDLKRIGYRHIRKINFHDENIKYILIIAIPLMIGVAVDQINVFVDKSLASRAMDGGVAILNYADRINALVYIVITSIVTVAYPVISSYAVKEDISGVKISLLKYAQIAYIFCIPVVVAFLTFSVPIVQTIYERGAFTQNDTIQVAICLFMYSFTMIGACMREITSRTFYSLGDSKTPVKNGIAMVILNAISSIFLSKYVGIGGIALGTSIASILGAISLMMLLRKKIGKFNLKKFAIDIVKILIISIFAVVPLRPVFDILSRSLEVSKALVLISVLSMLIYFSIIVLADISDSRTILKSVFKKIKNIV